MNDEAFDQAELVRRILAEFDEMSGLSLTLPQAAKLFDLDMARCAVLFSALVDQGVLVTRQGQYRRPSATERSE